MRWLAAITRRGLFTSSSLPRICTMSSTAAGTDEEFHEIVEGQASMLYAKTEKVFYNKVQVLNRDLSIQTISLFAEKYLEEKRQRILKKKSSSDTAVREAALASVPSGITVLDALAATGLRSIRYLKETRFVDHVVINDLLPAATEAARANVLRNGVDENRITIHTGDAVMLMYQHRDASAAKQFDVVDLDPYGSAIPFLDAAVQAVADGGLLCVTCTDMPVLSGVYPDTCYAKYGSMPLKGSYHAEMALRILLNAIDIAANKYKRHIVPWISVAIDFYVRVFVRVYQNPTEVKKACTRRCYVLQSTQVIIVFSSMPVAGVRENNHLGAPAVSTPRTCEETGGKMKLGGPFWSAPIHNVEIVNELLNRLETPNSTPYPVPTLKRLTGLLTCVSEEVSNAPFYYSLSDLCSTLHMSTIPMDLMCNAIVNAGYAVSNAHKEPLAIKTNAPNSILWDILRQYQALHPSERNTKKQLPPSTLAILNKESSIEADFSAPKNSEGHTKKRALRFPPNPEPNWGPKRKAGRLISEMNKAAAVEGNMNSEEQKEDAPGK